MDLRKAFSELCDVCAPSGFERPAAEAALRFMKPYMSEAYIDRFGNAVGVLRCGKENALRLLLTAHLDEVGFIVTGHEDGFLRFSTLGGVDPRMMPDREVTILTDPPVSGVITCLPPHILNAEDMSRSFDPADLRIDTGLSQAQAEKRIPVGTPVSYRVQGFALGKDLWCGKSIDDRGCFASLVYAASLLKPQDLDVDLYILGACREEVNSAGAETGTFAIDPNWAIAVDVTHARTPDSGDATELELGKGPAVGLGPNFNKEMNDALKKAAASCRIPLQYEVMEGNSYTDAWSIQIAREGIATALVELPLRYMHTPYEVVSMTDAALIGELLAAYAKTLGKEAAVC